MTYNGNKIRSLSDLMARLYSNKKCNDIIKILKEGKHDPRSLHSPNLTSRERRERVPNLGHKIYKMTSKILQ